MANPIEINATELRENNPYSTGFIFVHDDGELLLFREELVFEKSKNDRYYTVCEEDDLWSIADKAYGDSKYYWLIKDANNIDFALELPVGKTLLIPDLELARATIL